MGIEFDWAKVNAAWEENCVNGVLTFVLQCLVTVVALCLTQPGIILCIWALVVVHEHRSPDTHVHPFAAVTATYNETDNTWAANTKNGRTILPPIFVTNTTGDTLSFDFEISFTNLSAVYAGPEYKEYGVKPVFGVRNDGRQYVSLYDTQGISFVLSYDGSNFVATSTGSFDHTLTVDDTDFAAEGKIIVNHDAITPATNVQAAVGFDAANTYTVSATATATAVELYFIDAGAGTVNTTAGTDKIAYVHREGLAAFTLASWESETGFNHADAGIRLTFNYGAKPYPT